MHVDGNGDSEQGRRSVKRILVRALLASLALILFLFAALVTTIECRVAPAFLINRSDQAIERLTVSVVYWTSDPDIWSGPEVWSGRLEAGAVRVIAFPMRTIKGYPGEGRMAYGGLWADGRPIPETYGPGYLINFPYNHALVLDVSRDRILAQTVMERLKPTLGGSGIFGLSGFIDQALIVLFCWLNWLAGPVGIALLVMVAGFIAWRVRRRRAARSEGEGG
jgi:hypothetical protein